MAAHYGGESAEAPKPEFGAATITLVDGGGTIFEGTPTEQTVWESHNDEVTEAPPGYRITALSESCPAGVWRMRRAIGLVYNSIQKSMIQSTAPRCSRTS